MDINTDFAKEIRQYNGQISVIDTEHFAISIDKDWLSLSVSLSWKFRMFHVQILCFVFEVY